MRVDLPAPFSPTMACASPRSNLRLTPSSAVTPEKRLVMPSMRSSGVAILISCRDRVCSPQTGLIGFVDVLPCVAGIEESVFKRDPHRHALFAKVLLQSVEGERPEARVGFDRHVHLAINDAFERGPFS